LQHTKLELGVGYAGQVAKKGKALFVPDLREEPGSLHLSPMFGSEGFIAYFGAPMITKGEVKGVIELFHRSKLEPDKQWFDFVEMLATQAAIAIDNATMYRELEQHSAFLEQAVEEATGELRQSKEQVETILNNSPNTVLLLTPEGTIQQSNTSITPVFGYLRDEIRSEHVRQLVDDSMTDSMTLALKDALVSDNAQRIEILAIRKDKTTFDAVMNLAAIRHDNTVQAIVCTIMDISPLKAVERAKDAFVSNVSHELRTPITSIKLCHGLMKMNPDASDEYLGRLGRETDRLNFLIEDLLRLSRLDQGKVSLSLEPISLDELGSEYDLDRRLLAVDKGLDLSFASDEVVPLVLADKGLLGQACSVILTNAINYTPRGGTIRISTRSCAKDGKEWAGICFEDDGPGIAEQDLAHLFERFYRGASGRESGVPGTGLGLSIAYEIVNRHRGWIDVENIGDGEGARFTLWIPAKDDKVNED